MAYVWIVLYIKLKIIKQIIFVINNIEFGLCVSSLRKKDYVYIKLNTIKLN